MKIHLKRIFLLFLILNIFLSCRNDDSPRPEYGAPTPYDFQLKKSLASIDPVFDNTPIDNPTTNEGVELGRYLFYDQRLSKNDKVSCASCHQQEYAFSDPRTFSKGFEGKETKRHSMSIINMRWHPRFFWDARAATLEEQVLMPIQDPIEMGMDTSDLKIKLAKIDLYPRLFKKAFGSEVITANKISKGLAQFVRSIISQDSDYDDFYYQTIPRLKIILSDQLYLGYRLYNRHPDPSESDKNIPGNLEYRGANCFECHGGAMITDLGITTNGIDKETTDSGFGAITGKTSDDGTFKTPSLRNIAHTAPYMHDGRFKTLREVLDHYDSHIKRHPNLPTDMLLAGNFEAMKFDLLEEEKDAIIAYLNTFSDNELLTNPKYSNPF